MSRASSICSAATFSAASASPDDSASISAWGATVGAGVEGKVTDQWSLKLEYLYIGTPSVALSSPATTSIDERAIGNVIRVGANYRF